VAAILVGEAAPFPIEMAGTRACHDTLDSCSLLAPAELLNAADAAILNAEW